MFNFQDNLSYTLKNNNSFYKISDLEEGVKVSFKEFDWNITKGLYVQGSNLRHLHIKVRNDSFSWVIQNNMPFEDLSIGFQCRIDRNPDIYNVKFWDHFTNIYI